MWAKAGQKTGKDANRNVRAGVRESERERAMRGPSVGERSLTVFPCFYTPTPTHTRSDPLRNPLSKLTLGLALGWGIVM